MITPKNYKKGHATYTVPELRKLTGLSMQGARHRLEQFAAGLITQERLLRPAQPTRPRKRK